MAKKSKNLVENRLVRIERPNTPKGLYILHYQTYRGDIPLDLPWKAYTSKLEYELMVLERKIIDGYGVPEKVLREFIDKVMEVQHEDDVDNDVYESRN
jgi:hypothetical protein